MARLLALAAVAAFLATANAQCTSDAQCGANQAAVALASPLATNVAQQNTKCCLGSQTCYNPTTHGCCGTGTNNNAQAVYDLATRKCCPGDTVVVPSLQTARCPCIKGDTVGSGSCPADESCCTPSKFTDLIPTDAQCAVDPTNVLCTGECYNPNNEECCDVGSVYNPASQQCCVVSGIQDQTTPCPCDTNAHCMGGSAATDIKTNMACCQQTAPPLPTLNAATCGAFDNYPTVLPTVAGTIDAAAVPAGSNRGSTPTANACRGTCYDTTFQTCCNGATCMTEFQSCCNNTCCNTFTETCARRGYRESGAFDETFERCTSVEKLDEVKSFWIYILPTMLLLATLGSLALALVFASKAAQRVFSFLEKFIIAVAVLVVLFCATLYFSPYFVYGVVAAIAAIVAIIAASVRAKWLNILALVIIGFAILLFLDPFHGNNFLNTSGRRMDNSFAFPNGDGIWRSIDSLFPQVSSLMANPGETLCTGHYDYFRHDNNLRDSVRRDNPLVTTFGYCSRAWIVALLIFAALIFALLVGLFFLLLVGLALRFRKNRTEPIELEIVKEQPAYPPAFPTAMPVF